MAYVNFNRGLTRAQIEALTNAVNGKIYFATDGGIYVGKADGTAEEKADINYRTESKTGQEFVYRKNPATIKAKSLTLDRIYGKTLAWNQGAPYVSVTNTYADTKSTPDLWARWVVGSSYPGATISNTLGKHSMILTAPTGATAFWVKHNGSLRDIDIIPRNTPAIADHKYYLCYTVISADPSTVGGLIINSIQFVDLTLYYGSEIDGLTDEQILAKFESEFPGYHDFGNKLISNDAESIETVGFNLFDESTFVLGKYRQPTGVEQTFDNRRCSYDYFPCLPDTDYYLGFQDTSSYGVVICWYDANQNFISGVERGDGDYIKRSPSNAAYFRISSASQSGWVCINLSDPAKNGTYEPYRKSTMQLNLGSFQVRDGQGNVTTITGGLKRAGTAFDEIVGNKLAKRIKRVDLGSLTWTRSSTDGTVFFKTGVIDGIKHTGSSGVANLVCSIYTASDAHAQPLSANDKQIGEFGGELYVYDTSYSSGTAAQFKTGVTGYYVDLELDTPIEYELVEPLVYSMAAGTTEARISPNSDGLSAPFCCDMTYDANANNDSANAQYALAAGRLYNTHKLWGQDFDGSQDVSGAISGATTINASGAVTGGSFVKSGGTSSQFLKADGSVDSNTYAKTSSLPLIFGTGRYGSAKGPDSALTASGEFSFAYGCAGSGGGTITASNNGSVAFGDAEEEGVIVSSGSGSFAAGSAFVQSTIQSSNVGSVAMGNADNSGTIRASGIGSRAIGYATNDGRIEASGHASEAIGFADSDVSEIIASGVGSYARGCGNDAPIFASGKGSTAIGAAEVGTIRASGKGSIAIGNPTGYSEIHAKGNGSFAHGYTNAQNAVLIAYGASSHAEGAADAESINGVSGSGTSYTSSNSGKLSVGDIVFSGFYIAQVVSCTSSSFTTDVTLGSLSNTTIDLQYGAASGDNSHSEGRGTRAIGYASHSEGYYTTAQNAYEHAMGKYNKSNKASTTWGDTGNTLHSIGIGTGNTRKNAFEVMQNGDIYINGTGNYDGTNPSTADTLQQQILVLTEHIAKLTAKINTLEAEIDNRGNLTANTVDVRQGYTYNGDLLILTGSGAPTTVPAFVGQFYINTSEPSLYYAINNSAASDWKQA